MAHDCFTSLTIVISALRGVGIGQNKCGANDLRHSRPRMEIKLFFMISLSIGNYYVVIRGLASRQDEGDISKSIVGPISTQDTNLVVLTYYLINTLLGVKNTLKFPIKYESTSGMHEVTKATHVISNTRTTRTTSRLTM